MRGQSTLVRDGSKIGGRKMAKRSDQIDNNIGAKKMGRWKSETSIGLWP